MSTNLLKSFEREQNRLLLATLPLCGRGDYNVPEVDQQRLLARMELQRLERKGGC